MKKTLSIIMFLLIGACASQSQPHSPVVDTPNPFGNPESVFWDGERNTFYVSNIAGNPAEADGVGWISKLDSEGKVIQAKWIDGLNAPKGMALIEKRLYVSDIHQLVEIDIENAKVLRKIDIPQSQFLNDLIVVNNSILISDTGAGVIFEIDSEGKVSTFTKSPLLASINGLYLDGSRIIGGCLGQDGLGDIVHISLDGIVTTHSEKAGKIDGIVKDGDGFLLTDFRGFLLHMDSDGKVKVIEELAETRNMKSSADLGFDPNRRFVGIPDLLDSKVVFFKIK